MVTTKLAMVWVLLVLLGLLLGLVVLVVALGVARHVRRTRVRRGGGEHGAGAVSVEEGDEPLSGRRTRQESEDDAY